MLVLSRKKMQSIVIGEDITVQVIDIKGDQIRLGIEAPKDVSVHRREVFEDIKAGRRPDQAKPSVPRPRLNSPS